MSYQITTKKYESLCTWCKYIAVISSCCYQESRLFFETKIQVSAITKHRTHFWELPGVIPLHESRRCFHHPLGNQCTWVFQAKFVGKVGKVKMFFDHKKDKKTNKQYTTMFFKTSGNESWRKNGVWCVSLKYVSLRQVLRYPTIQISKRTPWS